MIQFNDDFSNLEGLEILHSYDLACNLILEESYLWGFWWRGANSAINLRWANNLNSWDGFWGKAHDRWIVVTLFRFDILWVYKLSVRIVAYWAYWAIVGTLWAIGLSYTSRNFDSVFFYKLNFVGDCQSIILIIMEANFSIIYVACVYEGGCALSIVVKSLGEVWQAGVLTINN